VRTPSVIPLLLAAPGLMVATVGLYLEPLLVAHRRSNGEPADNNPVTALIPLFGVTALLPQGRQANEGGAKRPVSFSIQALFFEILLAALFALIAVRLHGTLHIALGCLYAALLFEIAVIDFHYRLVLNVLSYPAALVALVGGTVWVGIGLPSALLGGGVGLVIFFVIELIGRGAMGRGDTKLATVIGLMRGYPGVWGALILGILIGGVMALGLLVAGQGRRQTFAYGPALALGAVVSLLVR